VNYELYMGEALAEARLAAQRGERPVAAVAVIDDAMVARAHDRVREATDPTAHAVMVALRETSRKLGTVDLSEVTIFTTCEPSPMCVGALLESQVQRLVYAVADRRSGAAGTVVQLARSDELERQLEVVSGIRADEAYELVRDEPWFARVPSGVAGRS
jgi:tRNA(adenine34) deaminase